MTRWPFSHPPNTQFTLNRQSPLAAGLVGWWSSIGSGGANTLRDYTDRRNAATLLGSPAWVQSDRGLALNFDGTDDYATVSNVLPYSLASQYTLFVRARLDTVGSRNHWFIEKSFGATTQAHIYLWWTGNNQYGLGTNRIIFGYRDVGNVYRDLSFAWTPATGVWYDITATLNVAASQAIVYVNGLSLGTVSAPNAVNAEVDGTLYLGRQANNNASQPFLDGQIREAGIWHRALGAADALRLTTSPYELYQPVPRLWPVPFVVADDGGGGGVEGEASLTLGTLTLAATGEVAVEGDASATLAALTLSAAGTVEVAGEAELTLGALTLTAAGDVAVEGDAALTLGALTVTATGVLADANTGAANLTLGALTVVATGGVAIEGQASQALGALIVSAAGDVGNDGDASLTLGALTVAAAGEVAIEGQAVATLGALTLAATAVQGNVNTGQAVLTLGALTVSAAGQVPVTGAAILTLGMVTLDSIGTVVILGAATLQLGALTLSAAGGEPGLEVSTISAIVYGPAASGAVVGSSSDAT